MAFWRKFLIPSPLYQVPMEVDIVAIISSEITRRLGFGSRLERAFVKYVAELGTNSDSGAKFELLKNLFELVSSEKERETVVEGLRMVLRSLPKEETEMADQERPVELAVELGKAAPSFGFRPLEEIAEETGTSDILRSYLEAASAWLNDVRSTGPPAETVELCRKIAIGFVVFRLCAGVLRPPQDIEEEVNKAKRIIFELADGAEEAIKGGPRVQDKTDSRPNPLSLTGRLRGVVEARRREEERLRNPRRR